MKTTSWNQAGVAKYTTDLALTHAINPPEQLCAIPYQDFWGVSLKLGEENTFTHSC